MTSKRISSTDPNRYELQVREFNDGKWTWRVFDYYTGSTWQEHDNLFGDNFASRDSAIEAGQEVFQRARNSLYKGSWQAVVVD